MEKQYISRQRVMDALNFRRPDALPCSENYWEDTLINWRQEGMPEDVTPQDFFDLDIEYMSIDASPRYPQAIVNEEGDWYTYTDRWGYSAKKKRGKSSSVQFFNHLTEDEAHWRANKHRWVLDKDIRAEARIDRKSYFEHFDKYPTWEAASGIYRQVYNTGRYLLYNVYGPWEATWRHCGYEELLMDLIEEPDWVRDMAATHIDLTIAILEQCLDLGMKPDGIFMVDDLAENNGPLFSPTTWREIFKPEVKKLGEFLQANGIDFWTHCCGNPTAYFPDFIECGIRVVQPLQASTGLHVARLREEYGQDLVFFGNLSAPNMSGDLDELEREIAGKVKIAAEGGYIFHSDHSIPPTVSLERYQWVLETARRIMRES